MLRSNNSMAADNARLRLDTCFVCLGQKVPIQYELTSCKQIIKFCSVNCFAVFRKTYKGLCMNCNNLVKETSMYNSFCTNMCKIFYELSNNVSMPHDDAVLIKRYDMTDRTDESVPAVNWRAYLKLTGSQAAPLECFKQAPKPPYNYFKIGMLLETEDPRRLNCTCVATVVDVQGARLRLSLNAVYSELNDDFWQLVDSAKIQPIGHCAEHGGHLQPPQGIRLRASTWAKHLRCLIKNSICAAEEFFQLEPPAPAKNLFRVGQKLEAVDGSNPHMIRCATVKAIKADEILLTFDGWQSALDYWCHYESRDIFPVGWCNIAVAAPVMLHFQRNCKGGPFINCAKLPAFIMAPTHKTLAKLCLQTILNANAGKNQLIKLLYELDADRNIIACGKHFKLKTMSALLVTDANSLAQFVEFMCSILMGCPNLITLVPKAEKCSSCCGYN